MLRRVSADTAPSTATLRLLAETLYPLIVQGREASHDLALTFYREQRAQYTRAPLRTVATPSYELSGLVDELRRTSSTTQATSNVGAMVVRHVEQGGRETITQQSRADPKAIASARVASGRETCAFCTMLIARGPVYSTTSGDFRAHDRCDCVAVPVFDRADYAGRDQYVAAYKLWKDSVGARSGVDALKAFRQAHRDDASSGDDTTAEQAA